MEIDAELLEWLQNEVDQINYGEVGLILIVHDGQIVRHRKVVEKKEQLTKKDNLSNMNLT